MNPNHQLAKSHHWDLRLHFVLITYMQNLFKTAVSPEPSLQPLDGEPVPQTHGPTWLLSHRNPHTSVLGTLTNLRKGEHRCSQISVLWALSHPNRTSASGRSVPVGTGLRLLPTCFPTDSWPLFLEGQAGSPALSPVRNLSASSFYFWSYSQ